MLPVMLPLSNLHEYHDSINPILSLLVSVVKANVSIIYSNVTFKYKYFAFGLNSLFLSILFQNRQNFLIFW